MLSFFLAAEALWAKIPVLFQIDRNIYSHKATIASLWSERILGPTNQQGFHRKQLSLKKYAPTSF